MNVTVKFFVFKHLAGTSEAVLELPAGATLGDLVDRLRERFPRLFPEADLAMYLVNQLRCVQGTLLNDGDQILMLRVSAGG